MNDIILKKNIEDAIKPFGAMIIIFKYDKKCFGNVFVQIIDNKMKMHNYSIDRGDIYINAAGGLSHSDYDEENKYKIFIELIINDLKQ